MTRALSTGLALLCTLLAVGCTAGDAEHAADDHAAVESHARAMAVTSRMLAKYRDAKSYTDQAVYTEESVLRGEGVSHELPYYQMTLAFQRPNRLRLKFTEAVESAEGARQGFDIACDGEVLRALMPELPEQMVENPAPAALTAANALADPLIQEKLLERSLGDVFPQLAMLLNTSDDDNAAVFPNDSNPRLLADESLAGRKCYRVATSHPEGTRVLWVDAESFALRRMELPVDAHRRRIDPNGNFLRLSVRIDFEEMTFDAEIAPQSFALAPPEGVHRVRRFVLPAAEAEETGEAAAGAVETVVEETRDEETGDDATDEEATGEEAGESAAPAEEGAEGQGEPVDEGAADTAE